MKAITQTFTDRLNQKSINAVRQVYYKRRYWSGSVYVWEAAWTLITEDKIIAVSPITSQLDIQTQNAFAISSVTINLRNFDNEWNPANNGGRFGTDAGSAFGYEPYWTKFQIRGGLVYSATSSELVTLFTGVATDFNFNTRSHDVQVTVSGLQDLLLRTDASNLSTLVTAESLGTGNGATTAYTTAHNGVAVVKSVSIAGVVKRAGVDYTLSQMADPVNPAKVTFIVAPANATALTITYTWLAQGQKVETLVTNLLNLVPIASGNQQVSTVTFPTNIINTHTWQTQTDWQGGSSLTDIDTTYLVNSIKLDFAASDASQLTTWGDASTGWSIDGCGGTPQFGASYLGVNLIVGGLAELYRPLSSGCGRWSTTNSLSATGAWAMIFMANNVDPTIVWRASGNIGTSYYCLYNGYSLQVGVESGGGPFMIRLMRMDGRATYNTTLTSTTMTADGLDHDWRVVRYPSGLMTVYRDGSLILSATDTTYSSGSYFGYASAGISGYNMAKTGTVYTPAATVTGTWISSIFDSGATPSAWTQFQFANLLGSGTISYSTASSADNITYDSYVAVGGGGIVNSILRRYVKVKIILVSTLISNQDPVISSVTIGSLTSSTVVTMANFTGITVYDAITQLAAFSNYEFGFDSSENFFFRARSGSKTPVLTLSEKDFIVEALALQTEYDLVYSGVRATYGSYTTEVDDMTQGRTDPTPRFGANIYQISQIGVLISADADLASNIATAQYAYYKTPRRKTKLMTKFLPQIDLSDIVSVAVADFSVTPQWFWGDTTHYWGDPTVYYYGAPQEVLAPLTAKVVGYRVDTDNWNCELDLEEVI